ncbi:hypothetical protein Tco_0636933, partial [Tanacetum coccineum]
YIKKEGHILLTILESKVDQEYSVIWDLGPVSIVEDCRLAREMNRMCGEVANVVQERAYFLEELDTFAGRVVPEKTAEFLKEIQGKDKEKMLQILGRETELRAHEKDLFIDKLKGVIPF